MLLVGFLILATYLSTKPVGSQNLDGHSYTGEMFAGLKSTKKARLYVVFLLCRRMLIILLLLCLGWLPAILKIAMMTAIQVFYYAMLLTFRPFIFFRDNALEAINESFFTTLVVWLMFFSSADNWNKTTQKTYMMVMIANSIVVTIFLLGKLNDLSMQFFNSIFRLKFCSSI